jgi:hypothetical protein
MTEALAKVPSAIQSKAPYRPLASKSASSS